MEGDEETNHALNCLRDLTHSEFQDQADGFVLFILFLYMLEKLASFSLVDTLLHAHVATYLAIFVNNAKADNLIAVFHKLFHKPLKSKLRVVVLVGSTEESARPTRVGIVFVLRD